jgi:hypothetical protein
MIAGKRRIRISLQTLHKAIFRQLKIRLRLKLLALAKTSLAGNSLHGNGKPLFLVSTLPSDVMIKRFCEKR